jgi:hypothetical protein
MCVLCVSVFLCGVCVCVRVWCVYVCFCVWCVYVQGVGKFLEDGNIALFSSHYFLKQPRTGMAVLWHQDGSYVPRQRFPFPINARAVLWTRGPMHVAVLCAFALPVCGVVVAGTGPSSP